MRFRCSVQWIGRVVPHSQPRQPARNHAGCHLHTGLCLSSFKISERSNRLRSQRKLNFPQSCKLPLKAVQLESLYTFFRSLINREGHFSFDIQHLHSFTMSFFFVGLCRSLYVRCCCHTWRNGLFYRCCGNIDTSERVAQW